MNNYYSNKLVYKPWGYEYWITGKNPMNELVLKFIHIKKGTKTSLQVHQEKSPMPYQHQSCKFLIKKKLPKWDH